jgi:hypothetical protein
MQTVIFIFLIMGLFLLEALTDGNTYISWISKTKNSSGIKAHVYQIIMAIGYGVLGYLYGIWSYEIFTLNTLYFLMGYSLMRYGLFDMFYIWVTGVPRVDSNNEHGKNSFWDRLVKRLPWLNHLLLRWGVFLIGVYLIVLTLKYS